MLNQMVGRCEKELILKDEKIAELEGVSSESTVLDANTERSIPRRARVSGRGF